MSEAIAKATAAYPPPWIVGWWRRDGRWSVEVNRRVGHARYERVVVTTGVELAGAAGGTGK